MVFLDQSRTLTSKDDPLLVKFECSFCERSYVRKSNLRRHEKQSHKELLGTSTQSRADQCAVKVEKEEDVVKVKLEVQEIALNEQSIDHAIVTRNRFPCEFCPKTFSRKNTLKILVRIHTGDKPYKCDHCQKDFHASRNLRNHKKKCGEKAHRCAVCQMVFLQTHDLYEHLMTHEVKKISILKRVERVSKRFKCHVNHKTFELR